MSRLLLLVWFSLSQQTPSSVARAQAMARGPNSSSQLTTFARQHADTLREALSQSLRQTAFARSATERSAELQAARRLAHAYANAWSDPFLARQVMRFEALSPLQQRAKLKGDSLRKAGNSALGGLGVPAALNLWRASLRQGS